MSNMTYCRFENTYHDLRDCFDYWDDVKSREEKEYQKKLLYLCQQIVDTWSD